MVIRMRKSSKWLSVLLILAITFGMFQLTPTEVTQSGEVVLTDNKDTIYIWYTDEALTDYISSAALSFYDDCNVRVVPVLYDKPEYLEHLYDASINSDEIPDLFIMGADSLEAASMTGLAVPVKDINHILNSLKFPQVALDAVTYKNQYFGYPFYYETAYLLYNETYLKSMAQTMLMKDIMGNTSEEEEWNEDMENEANGLATEQSVSEDGEEEQEVINTEQEMLELEESISANLASAVEDFEIPEGYSEAQWDDMMTLQLNKMIPKSIEDILNFADHYDAPENVENIFLWDVSDIFYNYFFAGAYMDVGGTAGDDSNIIEVYNEDTIECLTVYQELSQFFSIDSGESSYENVLEQFLLGKTIFTVATADAISTLDTAMVDGSFPYTYNVAALPGVDSEHEAVGLSVTEAVVINGYSNHKDEANAFAEYLTYMDADSLLGRTGKMPATVGEDDYVTDARDLVRLVYRQSKSLPKAMELSNFWLQLELAYTKIWDGEDVNETLRNLSEILKEQATGEEIEEIKIEIQPEDDEMETE